MEHGVSVLAEQQMFNSSEAIANAVRNKRLDAVTVTAEEYSVLGAELMSTNAILGGNANRLEGICHEGQLSGVLPS